MSLVAQTRYVELCCAADPMLDPHDPTLVPAMVFHAPCGAYGIGATSPSFAWNSTGGSPAAEARHSEGKKDAVEYPGGAW